MATLVLTAVGTAVGGPVGGLIGAVVGQQIDARIFKPKGRHGPRLGDLTVQTSSYGTAIAKIFGTMRVAGTVIWATDLQEHESTSGGGKGKPSTTLYSYSASFAVALSGRRVRDIHRIWADGKLLRGAAGDFKSATLYRLYRGGEDQPVDPLIAAVEEETPAFRGIAYALFEDFQLEDYGNRIPSLTFEVEADAAPVAIGEIAQELSDGQIADAGTPPVAGYAASGDSVRAAVQALGDVAPLSLGDDGARLRVSGSRGAAISLGPDEAGAAGAGEAGGRAEFVRRAAGSVAAEVSIAYYDPARDYQTGLQRATRGGPAQLAERLALPAVLAAGSAKAIAERRLAALWAGRGTAKLHVPSRRSAVRPGAHVRIAEMPGLWKVERWTLHAMVVSLELVRVESGQAIGDADASAGRSLGHPDLLHGPTTVRLLDLPLANILPAEQPHLLVAAAGAEPGWRRAALLASFDGGASWQEAGPTAAPAVLGTAVTALIDGQAALIDTTGSVEVELLNDGMWLEGRNDAALAAGANLALLGNELIQFGVAEPLAERRFRLSRLVRGRRGTEWAAGGHQAGEHFVLIEPRALAIVQPPMAALGGEARLLASGIGDEAPAEAAVVVTGEELRPPSPVHLSARRESSGDIAIRWARRSRSGWVWLSGSDTPLGEEREAYRLTLSGPAFERVVELEQPSYVYTVSQQTADGLSGSLSVRVRQAGTLTSSREAIADFTL
ncbi:MAG TPA: phage tail protein [Allosphingosinicella sp.]|nr:phage tail protein [Allosphingosinicella sp.]